MTEILKALRKFRKELDPIIKTADNPFYHSKYATLADIQKAIEPILDDNGLTLLTYFSEVDGNTHLVCVLHHDSGESLPESVFRIRVKGTRTIDKDGVVTEVFDNPQDAGSGISYALRYCISAYLGLTLEDDDGNRASGKYPGGQQGGKSIVGGSRSTSGQSEAMKAAADAERDYLIASGRDRKEVREEVLGTGMLNFPDDPEKLANLVQVYQRMLKELQ